ncbi:MAG TPA: hypothetical protein DCK76_02230 [Desulfotomaculum sp.]|nr:MAG: hypothetical protein XD84_1542 [Desulfotomaculum sp. 46_80]HAG10216.1 hypothetical protein [Desulfotomaculum sp.]HBY04264.1 hypothetical protein [Desulfotomaculum sp.]
MGPLSADALHDKLEAAFSLLKEAVDMTVEIKKKEAGNKQSALVWEDFLGDFWEYIRLKSRESGYNLLAGVSFFRSRRN